MRGFQSKYIFVLIPILFLTVFSVVIWSQKAIARSENQEYEACLKLTRIEPELAFESALSWRDKGGGFPARHCAALALMGMKKYHLAADRMEKIAEDMHAAGSKHVVAMLSQAANSWLLAEQFPRAHAVASAALDLDPGNIDLLIDRSRILAAAENYQEAFNDLDLALRLDPTRADALAFRAAAWRHLGNNERALEDADLALTLDPSQIDALIERGILHRLMGNTEAARDDWMTVLEITPHSPAGEIARRNIEKLELD
ncbi:tetratricopeptide repeat protein [Sneathiella glossodoripedis]|uniref:tetratricopeptide repeat protein n=1 Tax=Sneathiella glossodoripedis TaxID=418853 RepID=UPI0004724ED3|nr:hypothetical protein [Sneathiella glossodoripedis]